LSDIKKNLDVERKLKESGQGAGSAKRGLTGVPYERDNAVIMKLPDSLLNEPAMGTAAKPAAGKRTLGWARYRDARSIPGLTASMYARIILAAHGIYSKIPDFRKDPGLKISLDRELRRASKEGDLEAAKKARAQGADIEARDSFGCTPWMLANRYHHTDVMDWLEAIGADVTATAVGYKVPENDSMFMPIPAALRAPARGPYEAGQAGDESADSGTVAPSIYGTRGRIRTYLWCAAALAAGAAIGTAADMAWTGYTREPGALIQTAQKREAPIKKSEVSAPKIPVEPPLTPGEKKKLRTELDRAMKRGDEDTVRRIEKKFGIEFKLDTVAH